MTGENAELNGILTHRSLHDNPLAYPGELKSASYLLHEDRTYELSFPDRGRRLGMGLVLDYKEKHADVGRVPTCPRLNHALLLLNAANTGSRVPVVSIGSNAAPRQLYDKLTRAGASTTVPVIKAKVGRLSIAASAHVSAPGYIAVTPIHLHNSTASMPVFVALLDARQLEVIIQSEPNYDFVSLQGSDYRLELDNGERLSMYYIFRSKHGVIADTTSLSQGPDSQTRLITAILEREPSLARELGDVRTAEAFATRMSQDSDLRDAFKRALEQHGLTTGDHLEVMKPEVGGETAQTYLQIPSSLAETRVHTERLVLPSVERGQWRRGDHCVTISREDAAVLHVGGYCAVTTNYYARPLQLVVRVLLDDDVPPGSVEVDQVVRNALGVESRELLELRPARHPRSHLADLFLARKYIVARVQVADLTTMEAGICALPEKSMTVLGASSGDEFVLEGCVDAGAVRTARLKAYDMGERMLSRRESLSGGDWNARFPSASDAMGVYPDLPWVFLDTSARNRLGVDKLSPVRIRVSRRYQLGKDAQAHLIVLAVAGIGVLNRIEDSGLRLVAITLLVLLGFLIIGRRLRDRLR